MQKCFRAVDAKVFTLHVTTAYLYTVFNMLKHLQKYLEMFCKMVLVKTFSEHI